MRISQSQFEASYDDLIDDPEWPTSNVRAVIAGAKNLTRDSRAFFYHRLRKRRLPPRGLIPAIVRQCGPGAADKFAQQSGALDVALDRMIDEVEKEIQP